MFVCVAMDILNGCYLCVSGISVLSWQTKGTRFYAYPLRLFAGSANRRSLVQIHLDTMDTFIPNFFFHSSNVRGCMVEVLDTLQHTSIIRLSVRTRTYVFMYNSWDNELLPPDSKA